MTTLNLRVDCDQAAQRVHELTDRVNLSDLTTLELLALIALLEPADERVNGHTAPVLQLVPKSSRRRPTRTGTSSP